ncbi:MAG: peptidase domain-containing ABC transporter [Candidatus Methanoplasma sp.]|jgi:ATP-binding cassette subfamily B protein|nr:peptidase domain-containing ABC transporter [Candidatus Methanoplasma sp.]
MKVQVVEQHDSSDCGAACVASVCAFYGKELTIVKLRELLGTDISGTTVKGVADALSRLGFKAHAVRADRKAFGSGFTVPAVAHTVRKDGTSHYVAVYRVKKGVVRYMDPAESKVQKKTVDEFFEDFDGIMVIAVPDEGFVRNKEGAKSMTSSFMTLIKPHWRLFAVAIAISVVLTLFGIILSIFNKVLIDEIIPYNLDRQLTLFAIALVLVVATQAVLGAIRQHAVLYLSQKIDIPMMLGYFDHIFRLPMGFFASRKTGDIVTRFQDAGVVKNILTNVALTVIIDVSMVAIVGAVLFSMNLMLFAIIVLLTIVSATLIFLFKGPYRRLNKRSMEQGARLNSQVIESINGVETVKTNSSEDRIMEKIETEYVKALKIAFEGGVLSNIQGSLSSFAGGIGNLSLMVFGGLMVMSGESTLGTLVAFLSLSGFFIDPINRLVNLQLSIQEADISLKRLSEIYDVEEEEDSEAGKDSSVLSEGLGDVSIDGVSFRYGARPLTLKNVSISIPKGKKVAVVGRSGCGKTTLSKMLLKFYVPEEGKVAFNGTDLKNIDAFAVREKIGCVPQNVQMFSGSIRDNILIGKSDASAGEIAAACRNAGCDEFINKLPAGYDTFLDENGGGLSGGEKQRIALARALVKNPEFLILDEATSNMDFLTERHIYDTIFNKLEDTTMMIVAHRLSTIRRCDMIYVMEEGKVVESGTHDDLIEREGPYREMWTSQVGDLPQRKGRRPAKPPATGKIEKKDKTEKNDGDVIEYG